MIKNLNLMSFCIVLFLNIISCMCQESSAEELKDTLQEKTYNELYTYAYYNSENDTLFDLYTDVFLKKAYKENDTLKIATGYYIITYEEKDRHFKYNDSLIKYATYIKANDWLWEAYYSKGTYFNKRRDFKKAFESEVKALEFAIKYGSKEYQDMSIVSLGLLKERIGKYSEALEDYKKSYKYRKSYIIGTILDSVDINYRRRYLNVLHLLSNSYRLNNELDSAIIINKEIQKYAKFEWAKEYINKGRLSMAEVHFDKKEYQPAIDSAQKAIPEFNVANNFKSIAVCYYIIGESELKLGKLKKGINHLNKMDSVYTFLGDIYPPVRAGYETLIKHYKRQKNLEKHLYFVERLITFDSIIHKNYAYIYEGIVKKIEEPKLIKVQKRIQKQLDKSKQQIYFWLGGLLLVISFLFFEIRRRRTLQKYYQQKFDAILEKNQEEILTEKSINNIEFQEDKKELGIAQDVVNEILKALQSFEQQKLYTKTTITSTSVAKTMNTNANYLGRIIKHYYNKNFRTYVNDLRIQLALDKLRNDRSFKNFSVHAMANEVGFKNAEPFSKAFKATTGMYPSDFIVELKKDKVMIIRN